tara:strand:- start:246 stop:914 length:669 start_codon:yes stop_codon:yes gene_type:complete
MFKRELFLLQQNHNKTKRNYIQRMMNKKAQCMKVSKKYGKDYWDGNRKYGYGGYRYIPGRLTKIAKIIIKKFNLNNKSKILDIGCGKGFLLYEIKKMLPECEIVGIDVSKYALSKAHKGIKKYLINYDARKKLPFKKKYFDLAISFGLFHNFLLDELENSLKEFNRVSKNNYLMVESYKNNEELFNLQCWALTCESFLKPSEWLWVFKKTRYKGYFEFIYFT